MGAPPLGSLTKQQLIRIAVDIDRRRAGGSADTLETRAADLTEKLEPMSHDAVVAYVAERARDVFGPPNAAPFATVPKKDLIQMAISYGLIERRGSADALEARVADLDAKLEPMTPEALGALEAKHLEEAGEYFKANPVTSPIPASAGHPGPGLPPYGAVPPPLPYPSGSPPAHGLPPAAPPQGAELSPFRPPSRAELKAELQNARTRAKTGGRA
jgi:hypothetical protein